MTFNECIAGIIEMDGEAKAIQLLSQTLVSKARITQDELMNYKAAVNAIRKINDGRNEAIAALCDMEFTGGDGE